MDRDRPIHPRLEHGHQASDRFSGALATICELTNAQIAFVYREPDGAVIDLVGVVTPTARWCRDLTEWLKARSPRGGFWKAEAAADGPQLPSDPIPYSAAILPVKAGRPAWLVAIGLDPDRPLEDPDLRFLKVIWRLQVSHDHHVSVYENLKETLFGIVRCLSTAIDAKDPYTCGHSERVARIAVRLGEVLNVSRGEISDLYLAGLLHDVGKIGIRDEVLCKPSRIDRR